MGHLFVLWNSCYPHSFFKKAKGILLSPPSVRLSVMPSPPKPLDKIRPNFSAWVTHMNGACSNTFFGSTLWGRAEGPEGQISLNFNKKVNFKDFYTKLCVCSHK